MKRYLTLFMTLITILCCSIQPIYAASDKYVKKYTEFNESDISPASYVTQGTAYLGLLNPEDDSLCAEIIAKIYFEYADSDWVEVTDAVLTVNCYNDYTVSVSGTKSFGESGDSAYCRRKLTILAPSGLHIEYYIYAYANYYGDIDIESEVIRTYY